MNRGARLRGRAGIPLREIGNRRLDEEVVDAARELLPMAVRHARAGVTAGRASDQTAAFVDRLEGRAGFDSARLVLDTTVDFVRDRVIVVSLDPERQRLQLLAGAPR